MTEVENDVEWEVPGMFHLMGKDALDREIEQAGRVTINITRLTAADDVVVEEVPDKKKGLRFLEDL